jgi:hypothetical protein
VSIGSTHFYSATLTFLRRRANLEFAIADSMTPKNLATHFSRLAVTYKQYNITSADQVYNLDESRFSVRSANRGRAKALGLADGRTIARDLKWSRNNDRVTYMRVISAEGVAHAPVFVLQGKKARSRLSAF